MKLGNISSTNQKGQLVIPAPIRTALGISEGVPLQLLIRGGALYIVPIKDVVTSIESDNSFLDLLKKTKGGWRKEKSVSVEKRQLELSASVKRKRAW